MSLYNPASKLEPELNSLLESLRTLQIKGTMKSVPDETFQQLFSLVLKSLVNRLNDDPEMRSFGGGTALTATEAVIAVTHILKQVNVEVFELAMWQTMGSIR